MLNAIGEAAESLLTEHQDRLVGTRIGHYRVVSILGHGGMSTVYRGERDDAQYQQTVAIKVLHHATLHPRLRSRLHSERHILATLAHPSIARLIDSGELEDGTPYLVMEHVDGESIDAYCDSRTLVHSRTPRAVRPGLRSGAVRAPQSGRAPGHQGREHPRDRRRHAEAARLRHREAAGAGEPVAHACR